MKMMTDETKKGAHAMIVRRLDDGNATSLTWLKSREERDVDADAHDDDECSARARREEKRRNVALDDEAVSRSMSEAQVEM